MTMKSYIIYAIFITSLAFTQTSGDPTASIEISVAGYPDFYIGENFIIRCTTSDFEECTKTCAKIRKDGSISPEGCYQNSIGEWAMLNQSETLIGPSTVECTRVADESGFSIEVSGVISRSLYGISLTCLGTQLVPGTSGDEFESEEITINQLKVAPTNLRLTVTPPEIRVGEYFSVQCTSGNEDSESIYNYEIKNLVTREIRSSESSYTPINADKEDGLVISCTDTTHPNWDQGNTFTSMTFNSLRPRIVEPSAEMKIRTEGYPDFYVGENFTINCTTRDFEDCQRTLVYYIRRSGGYSEEMEGCYYNSYLIYRWDALNRSSTLMGPSPAECRNVKNQSGFSIEVSGTVSVELNRVSFYCEGAQHEPGHDLKVSYNTESVTVTRVKVAPTDLRLSITPSNLTVGVGFTVNCTSGEPQSASVYSYEILNMATGLMLSNDSSYIPTASDARDGLILSCNDTTHPYWRRGNTHTSTIIHPDDVKPAILTSTNEPSTFSNPTVTVLPSSSIAFTTQPAAHVQPTSTPNDIEYTDTTSAKPEGFAGSTSVKSDKSGDGYSSPVNLIYLTAVEQVSGRGATVSQGAFLFITIILKDLL